MPATDPFAPEVRPAEGAYIVVYDAAGTELASGIYDGTWRLRKGFTNDWPVSLDAAHTAGTATWFAIFIRETRLLMGEGPMSRSSTVRVGDRPFFAADTLAIVPHP